MRVLHARAHADSQRSEVARGATGGSRWLCDDVRVALPRRPLDTELIEEALARVRVRAWVRVRIRTRASSQGQG